MLSLAPRAFDEILRSEGNAVSSSSHARIMSDIVPFRGGRVDQFYRVYIRKGARQSVCKGYVQGSERVLRRLNQFSNSMIRNRYQLGADDPQDVHRSSSRFFI